MSDESLEPGYSLVMPFVTVTSKGGPHDDDAYCAGYEMGVLDSTLRAAQRLGLNPPAATIQAENRSQADLIAMHRGFTATFTDTEVEGWITADFTSTTEEPTDA